MHTYIIVDDEPLTRKGTVVKLKPLTDRLTCVGEASNGQQALELIAEADPEIIITDMNMPIMGGSELLTHLAEKYPDKQIIVISGYKDFTYAKHAITAKAVNYILKPFGKEELQSACLHAIQILESNVAMKKELLSSKEEKEHIRYEYDIQTLRSLILGQEMLTAELTSKRLNSINHTHKFILITIYCNNRLESMTLQDFLHTNGFGDLAFFFQHPQTDNLGFLVLFLPVNETLSSFELCRQITRSLQTLFEMRSEKVGFGISNSHSDLLHIHTAFEETVAALNSNKLNKSKSILFYQPMNSVDNSIPLIQWERENEFLFRIEAGMPAQVQQLLEELFHYAVAQDYTIGDIKYYCYHLSEKIKAIISLYMKQVKQQNTSFRLNAVWQTLFSLDDLQEYYTRIFANISEMLKEESVYAIDDTVEKMKLYVQRNYKNNLTVEFLSCLFFMNQNYCSHIFRAQTGEKFVDYVNKIRIQKSKELLLDSEKKMYQIAKAAGYENVKYFFRVFKKYEGITPNQYRQLNRVMSAEDNG